MKIIDSHAYVGESLFGSGQSPEELLRLMDEMGIDQAVLLPNKPKGYNLEPANAVVAEAVSRFPDRFYGVARVDPWQKEDALNELKRSYETFGLKGLLLHPWEEMFQVFSEIVNPLVSYAEDHKLLVMIEAGYPMVSHPLDIAELAKHYPQVVFIGTHGLQLDGAAFALTDAELAMRECDNLIMETSGMYAPEVMENLVRELGAHRLVFGSHTPWLDLRLEVERARLLNLESEQLEAIFSSNILRLIQ